MPKSPQQSNKRTGYINIGLTSMMYAQCEIAAHNVGEALNDFVHIALQQRLALLSEMQREQEWLAYKRRARDNNMPEPQRRDFDVARGYEE